MLRLSEVVTGLGVWLVVWDGLDGIGWMDGWMDRIGGGIIQAESLLLFLLFISLLLPLLTMFDFFAPFLLIHFLVFFY